MTLMTLTQNERPISGGFRVDGSRGERVGRVSSEWFSRPDDERYLSLTDLHDAVRRRAECAQVRTVESRAVKVEASRDNAERLALLVPGRDEPAAPTHWSFGQLCGLVGAPSSYMRQLPAPLAGINLQHGLLSHRTELLKTLEADDGRVELRAVTGPDYGRIWDHELVAAVIDIAGAGLRLRYRFGRNPRDPRDNILAGTAYLREMHDRYGAAGFLAAYNAGPGRYQDYVSAGRPLPAETRAHVAALAPLIVGGQIDRRGGGTAGPTAWIRASVFAVFAGSTSSTDRPQSDGRLHARPDVDFPRLAPLFGWRLHGKHRSASLFVARTSSGPPR